MGGGGGGGGGVISDIANTINPVSAFQNVSSGNSNAGLGAVIGNAVAGPGGAIIGANTFGGGNKQPDAPGLDPGLSSTLTAQQQQAKQFRDNLGSNEGQAFSDLSQATNQQLGQNLSNVDKSNNSRGLLYGGINQGQRAQQRGQAQYNLAQGRANINDQYQNAANQMDAAAINTGTMVQQNQQAIQDQIYKQALTNMMNQNNAFGSVLGAGAMAGGLALA